MAPPSGKSSSQNLLAYAAAAAGVIGIGYFVWKKSSNRSSPDVPPFHWNVSVKEIQEYADKVVADAKTNLDSVAAVQDKDLSFETVIRPLMLQPNYKTNRLVCNAKFLQHCSTDAAIREAAEEAGKRFAAVKSGSRQRKDVFERVKAYASTAEAKSLPAYEAHFLKALLSDFTRGGLALDEKNGQLLKELMSKDAQCCSNYGSNLGKDKTKLTFTKEALQGLSDSFIAERIDKDGVVTLTLKYPDILPVMSQCEVEETRKQMSMARESNPKGNLELVVEGITYRKQIAEILGYPSWSHFITETRMSGNPSTVTDFMSEIADMAKSGLSRDLSALRRVKAEDLLARGLITEAEKSSIKLEAWDTSFYHNQVLKRDFGVDNEKIREFFPLEHVIATTLEIYQNILGLIFTEIPKGCFETWHKDVRLFVVHDSVQGTKGERMGHFYLDLHPREGKYGHAAIFHLLKRNGDQTAVDCMLTNLPEASKERPALLLHSNVVTFFHEFGHIMHGLLARGDGNATHLAKCPRDFVEAPSQMLENWCWQPEVLAKLSKHYQTGESLPEGLIKGMIKAKNVHESLFMMRQIYLSLLDLAIHGEDPPASVEEIQSLVDSLRPSISGIANPPGANMLRNFGHLMNQYSASYYGYMWAEVISADMFATRFEADCMNQEAGMRYRRQILEPGGTGKIMDHLKVFLDGRQPEQAAFLKSRGILK